MSKMWQQRGSARQYFEEARKSLGDLFRRLASRDALERQSQGRSALFAVRHGFSTPDTSF